jgi:hypothetical protein
VFIAISSTKFSHIIPNTTPNTTPLADDESDKNSATSAFIKTMPSIYIPVFTTGIINELKLVAMAK